MGSTTELANVGPAGGRPDRLLRRDFTSPLAFSDVDRNDVRDEWADRSGEFSPTYYAYYGPNEVSEIVRGTLQRHFDEDAAILELGCSSGRHLAHLADAGFRNLSGVDINDEAFQVMEEHYPDLVGQGTFYCDSIEDAVADFEDDRFDAVYSVETLQHIHPEADGVFEDVARIADDLVLTVEIEEAADDPSSDVKYVDDGLPLYYRDWNRVFGALGFVQVAVTHSGRDTARTFRTSE